MRRNIGLASLVLSAAAAAACAPPPPPAAPLVVVPPAAPLAVAKDPAPPGPPAQVAEPGELHASEIAGAWAWNDDVQVFEHLGQGAYYRSGEVCYLFTYQIEGHIVTTVADRDHTCGATRENDWYIRVDHGELFMKHMGSGFETRWMSTEHP